MITVFFFWSESLLLDSFEQQEMSMELAEIAIAVAATSAPSLGYDKAKIQIRKDGTPIATLRVDIVPEMGVRTNNIYEHLNLGEREQIHAAGYPEKDAIRMDDWRY